MAFINRFSTTQAGVIVITGNTLGLSKISNQNAPGTLDSIGGFITTNTALPVPAAWASIVNLANGENITLNWQNNSSSAFLNIPTGATVLYAELIWSGRALDSNIDLTAFINNPILFTTPAGGPTSVIPDPVTAYTIALNNETWYVRSQNVTSLITAGGSGKYIAGAIPSVLDFSDNTSNFAGWSLIVAYKDASLPIRNMTVFAGGAIVNTNQTVDTTVSGFITPASGTITARILVSAGEGDATRTGDYMEFGPNTSALTKLFGPNNPANPPNSLDNFFGSQINIGDANNANVGQLDTTGSFGSRNSNAFTATNITAGRQGWDITNVDGSAALVNGQTTAAVRFATNSDQYLPNALGIQIDTLAADISVVKTASPNPVLPGQTLTYTLNVSNAGPNTAQNVTLTDAIPGTILSPQFSTDGGVTFNPWVSPYTIGTLANGASQTIIIKGTVSAVATGTITNTAIVNSTTPDTNPNNNTSTVTTQITSADVSIIKTASPSTVVAGQLLTYTMVITNGGPSDAQNVTLTDAVPGTILSPQFSTDGGVTFNPWVSPYTIGTLASGASVNIEIQGTLSSSATGTITNTATVSSTTPDPNPNNNTSQVTTPITTSADIAVVKLATPSTVVAGDLLTYNIVVTNGGPSDAQNVTLTDAVPATVLSPEFSTDGGVTFNPWVSPYTIGTLATGGLVSIIIRGTVASSATGNITNTATVSSTTPDPDPGDNTSTVITPITTLADVSVFKSATPSPVVAGNTLTYTVVVSNAGLSDAQGVILTDVVPATILSPQFSTDGGVTFNPWVSPYTIGTLASGGSQTILIKGTVASSATGTITNTATVSSTTPDPNLNNNTFTITTPVNASADISVVKTGSSDPILAGNVLTYTLLVSNAGPSDAQVVLLNDAVPAQILNPQFSTDGGATFNPWVSPYTIGTLASGASTTILIKGTVSILATGTIINTATVTSPTPDPNPNNNKSTLITAINTAADISVVKTGSPSPVISGQPLTYNIVVSNAGPNDAQNVTLTDVIPAQILSPQFSTDGGVTFNPWVSPYNIGLLANGATQTIIIKGTVNVSATGSITNTATVNSTTPDPNPNNNTSTVITPINQSADISVVKTGSPSSVIAGQLLTYNLVVSNAGPNSAQNVTLTDAVPATILSPQFSTDGGVTFNPWVSPYTVGTLTSGATQTIIIKGTVSPSATGTITNTATVSSTTPDPNPNNNTSTVTTPITTSADVSIVKTQSPNPIMPGQLLTYNLLVSNAGPSDAQNVVVTDIVSSQILNPQFSVNGGPFNPWVSPYTIGTLASGASVNIEIQGTLSSSATGIITNTATVNSSTPDPDLTNNTSTVIVTINASADVSVLKIFNPQNPNAGQNIFYTIVVLNSGPADAQNVTLSDVVPPQIQNPQFSIDGGVTFNPWVSPYTIGTLTNGSSVSIQIEGKILSSTTGTVTNTAKVASTTPDPNPNNNTSTTATLLSSSADVSVIKTAAPNPVVAGNLLTYNVVVTNSGPSDALNVNLADAVSGQILNPEYSTDGGITFNPWVSPYIIGTLASDAFVTIQIRGTVDPATSGNTTNTSKITSTTPDPNPNNNTSTVTVPISNLADVSVIKTVTPITVVAGDSLTYSIVVKNAGPSNANNVTLTDTIASGISNPQFSIDGGVTFNPWISPYTIGTLTNSASQTIIIEGTVASSGTGFITNIANVASPTPDPNPINNTSTVTAQIITSADISIVKTGSPSPAVAGQPLTYNLLISNIGPSDAQNVVLVDTVPSIIQNLQFSIDGGITFNPWITPYNLGTIPSSSSKTVEIKGNVVSSATLPISNTASVNSTTPDPNINNNVSTTTTPITASADISVIKTATPSPAIAGQLITYNLLVSNAGPSDAQNVTLTDVIPAQIQNPQFSIDGGITFSPWVSPYTIGTLLNGASQTIKIKGTLTSSATGTITNTATVNSSTPDPNPNNNTSKITTQINASADISVVKTDASNPVIAGQLITYNLLISNTGPSDSQNVTLSDLIPPTILNPEFSIDGGVTFNTWVSPYTIGTLANGASQTIKIRGTVASSATGTVTNTATVSSTTPDPNPINNTSTIATQINTSADISVVKTANPVNLNIGYLVTYTILISNAGPSDSQNVSLADLISSEIVSPQFSTDSGVTFNPWVSPYNISTLSAGASKTIIIRGTISNTALGLINNTAKVSSQTPDPNPNNNTSTVTVNVVYADLTSADNFVKTVDKQSAIVGDVITYTINVTNTGNTIANNVVITDPIPNGTSYVTGSLTANVAVTGTPLTVINITNGISPNQTVTLSYKVTVQQVPPQNPIPNTASVNYTYTVDPANPNGASGSGNTNTVTTLISNPQLTLTKSEDKKYAVAGEIVTYTITAKNTGDTILGNVSQAPITIFDTLSPNLLFVQNSVTVNGTPQPQSGILNGVNIGQLLPGQSAVITFQAKVISTQATLIPNTANASFGFQLPQGPVQIGNTTSNTVILTTEVANIDVIKVANENCAVLNDNITYTVTLKNSGTVDALNIIFEDALPTCVTLVANTFTLNGVAINGVDLTQGVNIENLKVSDEAVIQYTVELINDSCGCGIVNDATVNFSYLLPDGRLGTGKSTSSSLSQSIIQIGNSIFAEINLEGRVAIQSGISRIVSITGEVQITNTVTDSRAKIKAATPVSYQLAVYGILNQVIEYIPSSGTDLVYSVKQSIPFKTIIVVPENYCMCKNIKVKGTTNGICFNKLNCRTVCTNTVILLKVSACDCDCSCYM